MEQAEKLSREVQEFTFPFRAFRREYWDSSLATIDANGVETMGGSACLFQWEIDYQEALSICHADFYNLQRPHLVCIAACVELVLHSLVDQSTTPDIVGCVTIPEKSEKVRIVTPNEDVVAFVGSLFNSWLVGLLRQDPRTDPMEEPKEVAPPGVEVPNGFVIRSVDLVRASDQITGSDHKGILRGILRGVGIPLASVFARTLLFFSRPLMVKGTGPDGVFAFLTCGQPAMGRGPTWPVLSLYTLWCTCAAKPVFNRVVGDDAMFASSEQGSRAFDERLSQHNGQINQLKDIESTIGGTLVERCGLLGTNRKIEWHDTISVSSLDGKSKVDRDEQLFAPSFMVGPSIPYAPGVEFICEKTFLAEFDELRRHGLDPFVPREFGGPGYPCCRKQLVKSLNSLRPQWARALRIAMSQGQKGIGILLSLQQPWKSNVSDTVLNIRERVLQEIRAEQENWGELSIWEDKASTGLTIEEFSREVELLLVGSHYFWNGYPKGERFLPTIDRVAAKHRELVREINWLVPKNRLLGPVRNVGEGLHKYLTELRLGFFRVPIRYRTSPKIGTTMGYWKGESNQPPTDQGSGLCLGSSQGTDLFAEVAAYTGRVDKPFSSGERNTGVLARGTYMGLERKFRKERKVRFAD